MRPLIFFSALIYLLAVISAQLIPSNVDADETTNFKTSPISRAKRQFGYGPWGGGPWGGGPWGGPWGPRPWWPRPWWARPWWRRPWAWGGGPWLYPPYAGVWRS